MSVTVVSVVFRLSNGRSIELTMPEMLALRDQFDRIGIDMKLPAPTLPRPPCVIKRK